MDAMWVYLKDKVDCRSKLSDVVYWPEKVVKDRSSALKQEDSSGEEPFQVESPVTPVHQVIFHRNYIRKRYYELSVEDSSRNVIEMIFRAAATSPSRDSRKIERILRVKHSSEILERFEKYREMIKKKAYEQHNRHPRCVVDGNELLQFYGTQMNCCSQKLNRVIELCKDFTCQVCRIIQSGFDTEYGKKYGIALSSCSTTSSGNTPAIYKGANAKRAVIVCRIIAGRVVNMVDRESEDRYDSIRVGGLYSKLEYLIVRNPSAVLPCFVIVFT
ncbi:hypothetical protein CK203_011861 [Vitis vinifera]|uniref:Uncharacterized protein n=1 Tax=Vitis vinifera TaxID=29760 RepID=A0A438K0H7_VITVI|nr:hypothetical protein CK203_011861 [Vitis vinifera]